MAKRIKSTPNVADSKARKERAKAAIDNIVGSIHEDNRVLEGQELVDAIYEIFEVVRPKSAYIKPQ